MSFELSGYPEYVGEECQINEVGRGLSFKILLVEFEIAILDFNT